MKDYLRENNLKISKKEKRKKKKETRSKERALKKSFLF